LPRRSKEKDYITLRPKDIVKSFMKNRSGTCGRTRGTLPLERLCRNTKNAVIPAEAGIQTPEIVIVSN
jgi:hypothetical protein